MDFSNLTLSCSRLGSIMAVSQEIISDKQLEELGRLEAKMITKPLTQLQQEKYEKLVAKRDNPNPEKVSSGCKNYLKFIYQVKRYGTPFRLRGGDGMDTLTEGIKSEGNSLSLMQEFYKRQFYKDKRKISNKFLHGKIDIMDGETLIDAKEILEIKSILNLTDFIGKIGQPPKGSDALQMQGYLAIADKEVGRVVYCLPQYPEETIEYQKELLFAEMCPSGEEDDRFRKAWTFAENSMRRKSMPLSERIISHKIVRDEDLIDSIYEKVDICRDWLTAFYQQHKQLISDGKENYP